MNLLRGEIDFYPSMVLRCAVSEYMLAPAASPDGILWINGTVSHPC